MSSSKASTNDPGSTMAMTEGTTDAQTEGMVTE